VVGGREADALMPWKETPRDPSNFALVIIGVLVLIMIGAIVGMFYDLG
jgi:hypothetical protein